MELSLGANPSEKKIFHDLQTKFAESVAALAQQTRTYLDINIDTQTSWNTAAKALENWRDSVEEAGIFVFKEAFQDDSVDGFCLVHDEFPVIYLNNSRPPVRQIFTLFHELAHLLIGENGITRSGIFRASIFRAGITHSTKLTSKEIETFCDRFAAEFLVPSENLKAHLNQFMMIIR